MKKEFVGKKEIMVENGYNENDIMEMFGLNYVGSIMFDGFDGMELGVFFDGEKYGFSFWGCGMVVEFEN
ncbi:MAG: hypothetical protein RSA50_06470, partial [Mucinivorans sp.]